MSAEPTILKQATTMSPAFAEARFSRGAEILIEALVHEGVDSIFGYPGGAVLHGIRMSSGGMESAPTALPAWRTGKVRWSGFKQQPRRDHGWH